MHLQKLIRSWHSAFLVLLGSHRIASGLHRAILPYSTCRGSELNIADVFLFNGYEIALEVTVFVMFISFLITYYINKIILFSYYYYFFFRILFHCLLHVDCGVIRHVMKTKMNVTLKMDICTSILFIGLATTIQASIYYYAFFR